MISEIKKRDIQRGRRVYRVRKKLRGTDERPRLSVFKSNKHLFIQVINDEQSKTLLSAGTMSKELKAKQGKKSMDAARFLGQVIAQKAKENNITQVVFDRGCNKYHGIIAAFADAAREHGLQF